MKKLISFFALIICSSVIAGCAGIDVNQEYNRSYDYDQLKTFNWVPGLKVQISKGGIDDEVLDMRLRRFIAEDLQSKGYQKVEDDNPDFLVGFHAALNEPLQKDKLYEFSVREYQNFTVIYEEKSSYQHPSFDVGTVIVDIIDAKNDKILWRGSAETEVHIAYSSPEKRKKKLAQIIGKLLKDFPPQ